MASSSMETAKEGQETLVLPLGPGFHFLPTDYELVHYYLKNKILGKNLPADTIPTIDFYTFNPYDDITLHELEYQNKHELYFFTTRPKGDILLVKDGYWRPRLTTTPVEHAGKCIGFKRVLDFCHGTSPKERKSEWFIHEYSINPKTFETTQQDDEIKEKVRNFVVCKISKQRVAKRAA